MRHKIWLYFGRRGLLLSLLGLVWILMGLSFALIDVERFSRPGPGGILEFMDSVPYPGLFWIVCGAVGLGNGLLRRKLRNEDSIGYGLLIMPPVLWAIAYLWSLLLWVFTRDEPHPFGRQGSVIGLLVYSVVVVIIGIVATWPCELDIEYAVGKTGPQGSEELALLDRMIETKDENDARGERARQASESWIQKARVQTEEAIEHSSTENDRMIQAVKDELEGGSK